MLTRFEQAADEVARVRADLDRPIEKASGAPFAVGAMMRGHVIGQGGMAATAVGGAGVRGDAPVLVEDLDGRGGETGLHLARDERVRDAVVMAIDLDVIIDVDAGLLPFGEFISLGG